MSDEQPAERKPSPYELSTKSKCGADLGKKRPGEKCGRFPLKNQKRCKLHGGASPQAKRKAAEREAERKIQKTLGELEVTPVKDPLTALSELAGEIVAWKDNLALHVGELKSYGYAGEHGEQIKAAVQLYERAMDRAVTVLDKIARLDIDSRLAAIDERRVDLLERAIDAALNALDLTPEQVQKAWGAVEAHLTSVPRVA